MGDAAPVEAAPAAADPGVISRILGLAHVPQAWKVETSLYAPDNFPLLEKLSAALAPEAVVSISARLGFELVALLHGNPGIRQAAWFDTETSLPNATRLCGQNLQGYLKQARAGKGDVRCAFGRDFRAMGKVERLADAAELAFIDGSLGHQQLGAALDACQARRCDYIAVNHYNAYAEVRKAVDLWSASKSIPALSIESHFGLALFDLSGRQDAAARLQAAGVPLAGDRAIDAGSERKTCWCGGELLEFAHLAYGECARCGTLVRRRQASAEQLRDFYSFTGYWHAYVNQALGYPTIEGRAESDFKDRIPYYFSLMNAHRPGAGSVLEIGCAHGGFLKYCKDRGAGMVVGVEVDPKTCQFARQRFGLEHVLAGQFPDVALPQERYDVFAAFDVLEHVPDPVATLSHAAQCLAPGGIVLIEVPRYQAQGAAWNLLLPEHLTLFTQAGIQDLFRRCGLDIVALQKGITANEMCVVGRRRAGRETAPGEAYRPSIGIGMVERMGDIVANEPVVRHLRSLHPQARISWVTRAPYAEILEANPGIDEVVRVECVTDWIRMLRHRKFDLVYDLHINGRKCPTCQIPLQKSGSRCSGINFGNIFEAGRSVLAGSCKAAGLPEMDESPQMHIPAAAAQRVDGLGLPAKFVAMHCVSEEPARTWPAQNWVRLAELVHDRFGIPVVEIGMTPVLAGVRGARTEFCGLPIIDTAELIRRASGMVCVHSGFSHVANGCRVPAVVLAGKYEHYAYVYPFSGAFAREKFDYVFNRGGTTRELAFDPVVEAVSKMLSEIASRTTSR